jgi:hypothetical protein
MTSWTDIPAEVLAGLRRGAELPAHPLALDPERRFDRESQRALARYYIDAGAGGLAVGVHATQFAIREAGLYRPVLELAAETAAAWAKRPLVIGLLATDAMVTDCNSVIFDVANAFAGCIPGCHEVLRRQGLMRSLHCLDASEVLSPGQAAGIDRITAATRSSTTTPSCAPISPAGAAEVARQALLAAGEASGRCAPSHRAAPRAPSGAASPARCARPAGARGCGLGRRGFVPAWHAH